MYKFSKQTNPEIFDTFCEKNGGSVFQTSYWAKVKTAWNPYFYMGFENNKPVLSCLCLERNITAIGKLWHIHDGFVCDLKNKVLVTEFTDFLKKEMKKNKVFLICSDPLIPEKINKKELEEHVELDNLLIAGFELNSVKKFYTVQPNTDIIIPLTNGTSPLSSEEILKRCEKGVRQGIKLAQESGLKRETYQYEDIEKSEEILNNFFSVISETADRVSFIHRTKDYYKSILKELNGKAVMDLIYIDLEEVETRRKINQTRINEIDNILITLNTEEKNKSDIQKIKSLQNEKTNLEKNRDLCLKIQKETGENRDKLYLACGITSRFGKNAACLYGGTKNVLRNTLKPTHFLNFERIKDSLNSNCAFHQMGRVTGDPFDEKNPLYGLCKYKQSYGGEVYEYVGDLFLIGNRFKFVFFKNVLPKAKTIKTKLFRKIFNRNKS